MQAIPEPLLQALRSVAFFANALGWEGLENPTHGMRTHQ